MKLPTSHEGLLETNALGTEKTDGSDISVLVVTNSYFPADREGGPPFSNRELAEALMRAGARVRVISTDRNGSDRLTVLPNAWDDVGGVPVYYARTANGSWLTSTHYRNAVQAALADTDICVMSAVFWNYTGLVTWWACRRSGTPYISYVRGQLSQWAFRFKRVKKTIYWVLIGRRILNDSSLIIALAVDEANDMSRMKLRPPCVVVPNGTPRVIYWPMDVENDADKWSGFGDCYAVFLGRIHAKKGLDLLLPAFERVAELCPRSRLVIAGPVADDYRATFARLLGACRARHRIDVVGTVTGAAKTRLLHGARVFVLPSYGEGLPVAVLEALSVGTPVIITKECNLPEVLEARAGIEVDATIESVAGALSRILSDASLRQRLSQNAPPLVRCKFNWDAIGKRVLSLCYGVLRGT